MKTARITACTFDKSFDSKFGKLYQHTITLSNKDTGQISAKEEMPAWLGEGKELTYTIEPNGKYPDKIKRVNPKFQNGTQSQQPNAAIELLNQIHDKIDSLNEEVDKLKEVVKQLVKHTKMAYVAPNNNARKFTEEDKAQAKKVISPKNVTTMGEPEDDSLPF